MSAEGWAVIGLAVLGLTLIGWALLAPVPGEVCPPEPSDLTPEEWDRMAQAWAWWSAAHLGWETPVLLPLPPRPRPAGQAPGGEG